MIITKTIDVNKSEETECNKLVLSAYRDDDGEDGVLFLAWHKTEDFWLIQSDFIKMDFEHIHPFIRDYSALSAQEYVDRFSI